MSEKRKIIRNIGWNSLGLGLPLIVAVAAFPFLIQGMGTARFGVLLLAWMVVGYFSVFDFGLGRAITKLVAEKRGLGAYDELPAIIQTSLLLMAGLGLLGAVAFTFFSPWLVSDILVIPAELSSESLTAFRLLALSIPIVVISSALAGVLEAHQRFGFVTAVRLPLGLATFLVPLMILPISNSLVSFVAALVSVRALAAVAYASLCFSVVERLGAKLAVAPAVIPSLLRLGGWMTVSNLISPLMVYLDRFFIGAAISMSAVTYYTTPYEVVTRALMLPRAVMGVLFPEFSSILAKDPAGAPELFRRWRNYLFAMMFPFALVVVTLAGDLLTLWLGEEFANQSTRVLQYLAVGVLINSVAQLAFGLIQSAGKPEVTAKIHLIELPFYLFALWWLIDLFGIEGAAMAWVLRVGIDALILFFFAHRILQEHESHFWRSAGFVLVILAVFSGGTFLADVKLRLLYVFAILSAFVPFVWLVLLDQHDRRFFRSRLANARR